MKLFKKFSLAMAIITAFIFSTCFASPGCGEIPEEKIAIGGITFGATEEYVRKIYGEPTEMEYKKRGDIINEYPQTTYIYGNSKTYFKIMFVNGGVFSAKSVGNTGLKTPSGFCYGSKLTDVWAYYEKVGTPDPQTKRIGRHSKKTDKNAYAMYDSQWYMNFSFESDEKGKVKSISIYETP